MPVCEAEPAPVLHLPMSINNDTVYQDSLPLLEKIRPEWFGKVDGRGEGGPEGIQMRVFSGGLTNKLVGFYLNTDRNDVVIVKVYGEKSEIFIDREEEIKTMQLLHERKCGSLLYAVFENGIAYAYTPGHPLDIVNCRARSIYPLVAKEMARMHSIPLTPEEREGGSTIWKTLRKFYQVSLEALERHPDVRSRFEATGMSSQWVRLAIDELEMMCSRESMLLAFCHNDILLGNIIFDEERNTVAFIDFEYAATNYFAFDIANHFNEFAGDKNDFSLLPDEEFQRAWISEYLQSLRVGQEKTDLGVDTVYAWVQICAPISLMLWMLWGIVQTCYSDIDYDFFSYVTIRQIEYNKMMQVLRNRSENTNKG